MSTYNSHHYLATRALRWWLLAQRAATHAPERHGEYMRRACGAAIALAERVERDADREAEK